MEDIQQTLPELAPVQSISKLIDQHVPAMRQGSERAVAAMKAVTQVTTDEEYENANNLLVRVAATFKKINALRMEVTKPLDNLKSQLMEFERPLGDDKDSESQRVRKLMAMYNQAKIDEKARIEREAQDKKRRADHAVDIKTLILKNLTALAPEKAQKAESGSAAYFKATTLETFDQRMDTYRKTNTKLKQEDYDGCFKVAYRKDLMEEDDFLLLVQSIKETETYDKWNDDVMKAVTPIVNAWRAKIDDYKVELQNIAAAGEQEKLRLQKEKEDREKKEAEDRQKEIQVQADKRSADVEAQAGMEKMNNSFVAQATVQQVEDVAKKYRIKFTDPVKQLEAMMNILAHVMSGGHVELFKKDAAGKVKVDKEGFPEYEAWAKPLITAFESKCDEEIPGIEWVEVAKVTVRK